MIHENNNLCNNTYTAGACNSNSYAADWSENNLICIAVGEAVAILKSHLGEGIPGRIIKTYLAHKSRINVVKWIRNLTLNEGTSFISASIDGSTIIWMLNDDNSYIPKFTLKGHTESVTDVTSISFKWQEHNYILAASLSIDILKFWKKTENDEEFSCFCTIHSPGTKLGVSGLEFAFLPNSQNLIFASCKEFVNVCLYTCVLDEIKDSCSFSFTEVALLSGHTNWVNDLTFTTCDSGKTLLLASASHDYTIRIWRISQREQSKSELHLRELTIKAGNEEFSVSLCSILHGHDQWIYTVQWKHFNSEEKEENRLKLLSVSADKTAIIWQRDLALNTWIESYRLGDVGGNVAGFLGGCFDPAGQFVMTHDLAGAFHVWQYNKNNDSWSSASLPSGHNDVVNDIQWDPNGQFLVSVSADKTTRLHVPLNTNPSYWYEFARPQIHGHAISCLAVFPKNRFISGAAEKELRSFIAPKNFIQRFKKVSFLEDIDESKYLHVNAILPSLDLSNKPAEEVKNMNIEPIYCDGINVSNENQTIPTEEELGRNTLWPEIQKLYYHPNEISCITSNFSGTLMASACRANSPKEASIAIWSVKWDNIERIQELWFHQLTVTELAFSPDDMYLLSVSRDRTWHLFKKKDKEDIFESVAFLPKTNAFHKRQLNSCAWSHDSKYFASGSRDSKVIIWHEKFDVSNNSGKTANDNVPSFNGFDSSCELTVSNENICSLAFSPGFIKSTEYLIAIGFGSGKIGLYFWNGAECHNWLTLEKDVAHHKEVTKIAFRPVLGSHHPRKNKILQLASAGADRLVRIYDLDISLI